MPQRTNYPDSDQSNRRGYPPEEYENPPAEEGGGLDLQTSHKSGKHSSVVKEAASRPESGEGRKAGHVSGAFGSNNEEAEKRNRRLF
jgi:hypothetical protein